MHTFIQDQDIEIIPDYKYLGTIIDKKLTIEANTEAVCKKVQRGFYCLRKVNYF